MLHLEFGRIGWRLNDALANLAEGLAGEWVWARATFGASSDEIVGDRWGG